MMSIFVPTTHLSKMHVTNNTRGENPLMKTVLHIMRQLLEDDNTHELIEPKEFREVLMDFPDCISRGSVFFCGEEHASFYKELKDRLNRIQQAKWRLQELALKNNIKLELNTQFISYDDETPLSSETSSASVALVQTYCLNTQDSGYAYIIESYHVLGEAEKTYEEAIAQLERMDNDESFAAEMLKLYMKVELHEHNNVANSQYVSHYKGKPLEKIEKMIRKKLNQNPVADYEETFVNNLPVFAHAIIKDERCKSQHLTDFIICQKVLDLAGILNNPLIWLKKDYWKDENQIKGFISAAYNSSKRKLGIGEIAAKIYQWFEENQYIEGESGHKEQFVQFFMEATGALLETKTLQNNLSKLRNTDIGKETSNLNQLADIFELKRLSA